MNAAEKVDGQAEEGTAAPDPFPVHWEEPSDALAMWIFDQSHTPDQISPLDYDLRVLPIKKGSDWVYQLYGMPFAQKAKLINTFHYQQYIYPDMPAEDFARAVKQADAVLVRVAGGLEERWYKSWLPEVQTGIAEIAAFDLQSADLASLLRYLPDLERRTVRLWQIHTELLFPMLVAISGFEEVYRDLFPEAQAMDAYDLLSGFPNKTVEGDIRLWELGRHATHTPALRALIVETALADLPAALAESSEGRALWGEIQEYLSAYGQRSDKLYLDSPTWIEDPSPVLRNLREAVSRPDRDLAAELRNQVERREARILEVRHKIASYPRAVVEEFEASLKAAQIGTVLSEDHHYWIDCKITHYVRRVCLEVGRRLAERGSIAARDDVFYLTLAELSALASDLHSTNARARIAERRSHAARFRAAVPPPFLGTPRLPPAMDGALVRATFKFAGAPGAPSEPGEVRGMAGSRGRATGTARIAATIEDAEKLHPGDILVAPCTLPSWTPFFAIAAAVVTNTGGVLCHAAVVAREYGIPAVVGTRTATVAIRDGQTIEVDGDAGVVRILAS